MFKLQHVKRMVVFGHDAKVRNRVGVGLLFAVLAAGAALPNAGCSGQGDGGQAAVVSYAGNQHRLFVARSARTVDGVTGDVLVGQESYALKAALRDDVMDLSFDNGAESFTLQANREAVTATFKTPTTTFYATGPRSDLDARYPKLVPIDPRNDLVWHEYTPQGAVYAALQRMQQQHPDLEELVRTYEALIQLYHPNDEVAADLRAYQSGADRLAGVSPSPDTLLADGGADADTCDASVAACTTKTCNLTKGSSGDVLSLNVKVDSASATLAGGKVGLSATFWNTDTTATITGSSNVSTYNPTPGFTCTGSCTWTPKEQRGSMYTKESSTSTACASPNDPDSATGPSLTTTGIPVVNVSGTACSQSGTWSSYSLVRADLDLQGCIPTSWWCGQPGFWLSGSVGCGGS